MKAKRYVFPLVMAAVVSVVFAATISSGEAL
jgi:hypothetical protein